MSALVTLADILVSDARVESEGNPFRVLLSPLALTTEDTAPTPACWQGGSSSLGGIDVGTGEGGVERRPLMAVTAKTDGDGGAVNAEIKLSSFAFNVMIDAIKDSLVVLLEVNIALLEMLGATGGSANKKAVTGGWGCQEAGGMGLDPLGALGVLDEEEATPEVCEDLLSSKDDEGLSMHGLSKVAARYKLGACLLLQSTYHSGLCWNAEQVAL